MEQRKSQQVPTFGNWDYGDQMPITQYFESARQAGLVRAGFLGANYEVDFFNVPVAMPVKLAYQDSLYRRKVRKETDIRGEKKACSKEQKQRKEGRAAAGFTGAPGKPIAAPKAVDEDLYKIPPELLCQRPKKKRFLRNLFLGCLGLNCVA